MNRWLTLLILCLSLKALASTMVYVPENFAQESVRVVVVIHGCFQSPESMALGTEWNSWADKHNLVIIYPKVPKGTNGDNCWNWFDPKNQKQISGQLRKVADEIVFWKDRLNIKKAPVFVTGISSGAATAAGLLACFPQRFSAGALHSGPPYGLAANKDEAEDVMKFGSLERRSKSVPCDPSQFNKPVMIIQGKKDIIVRPPNVNRNVIDFLSDTKVSSPISKKQGGLDYTITDYYKDQKRVGRVVMVENLGHEWSGYGSQLSQHLKHAIGPEGMIPTKVPFFNSLGPSSTQLIFEFFQKSGE